MHGLVLLFEELERIQIAIKISKRQELPGEAQFRPVLVPDLTLMEVI